MTIGKKRIAFIMNAFPTLSETFIVNEVIGLRKRGLDIHIWSLFVPTEDKENPELKEISRTTKYLTDAFRIAPVIRAHSFFLFTYPRRYLKILLFCLKHRQTTGRFVFWPKFRTTEDRQDLLLHFILALPVAHRMRGQSYDLLHAHFADAAASLTMLVSRLLNIPYSMTMHAFDVFIPQVNFKEKFQNAEFIITCTKYNKTYLQEHYNSLDTDKIHVVYHGIDLDKFSRKRQRRQEPPVILAVGRLIPKKGLPVLIQACKLLKEAGYEFKCRIIGDGPLRPRLEMIIKLEKLVDFIELAGAVMPSQIIDEYARATLFALPCMVEESGNRDGIPNVIAEALAMNLPVISTNVSAIPELIEHQKTGFLIAPGDYQDLFENMRMLLDAPSKRRRIGTQGRAKVEQVFDAREKMDQLFKLYQSKIQALYGLNENRK
ncbi:glycosyltransferase [candidate division KSB1 bacterium]|nr:glycosyltransferase [candidate division KSB1 bacterium]